MDVSWLGFHGIVPSADDIGMIWDPTAKVIRQIPRWNPSPKSMVVSGSPKRWDR